MTEISASLVAAASFSAGIITAFALSFPVVDAAADTPDQMVITTVDRTPDELEAKTPESLLYSPYSVIEEARRSVEGYAVSGCDPILGSSSLRNAFVDLEYTEIIKPMQEGTYRVTSRYGMRIDPVRGYGKQFHKGVDFAAPIGTPIYSVADGVVVEDYTTTNGHSVVIKHELDSMTFHSVYVHSYDYQVYVKRGDVVKLGQHIADVGSKGYSTGPHLHFEVHPGDTWNPDNHVNPEAFFADYQVNDISRACLAP